ncbi:MAG TPA: TIGR03086 family metal-binding protein [Candidatus Dormibacteraeota bacterium]
MDTRAFFSAAADGFGRRLATVGPDQWRASTPCAEWDVRALVQHVVNECRWIRPLIEGRTIAEVGDRLDGDLLGADPDGAWRDAYAEALASIAPPEALSGAVHLSFGDRTGDQYISQVACDVAIHTWDLARGTGGDDHLDPEVVAAAQAEVDGWGPDIDAWRAAGVFGPAVESPAGADAQTRLLGMVGRRAHG